MKKLLLVTLCLFATSVFGAEATSTLSWSAPTERQDGTPLASSELAQYKVYYSVDSAVTTNSEHIIVGSDTETKAVTLDLTPRVDPYTVSFAIVAIDTDGLVSPLSEPVSKTFNLKSTAVPVPPTGIEVTVRCGKGCTIEVSQP